mgnify:CR=1 FL=1
MSVLRLLSLVLILALVLLASGCRGSMVIATLGDPDDDDSVLDDDDMTRLEDLYEARPVFGFDPNGRAT